MDPISQNRKRISNHVVKKKDGKLRLCVDYRALNDISKKDGQPLPLSSEALDRLAGAKYFTKLDIEDAYDNIRIKEGDEYKTALWTNLGTYEYRVMPFWLCNVPSAFQRWINETLMEYFDMCCIVYPDDVLIYSNNLQQHRQDVSNNVIYGEPALTLDAAQRQEVFQWILRSPKQIQ